MKNRFFLILFFLIFLIKSLESLLVYKHVDALNYHIVIAKYLVNNLSDKAWYHIPGALMSGYFEYLYTIPHLIFNFGLKAHIGSQFLHFLFSLGIGSLIIFSIFKKKNFIISVLAAISILTISKGSSFFLYAKNDGVLALIYLSTLIYFLNLSKQKLISNKEAILFGVLLGLNPAIKQNGLIFIAPISLYFCYIFKEQYKKIAITVITAFIVWFPIIFRNWYYFDSPLFPGGLSINPGIATPEILYFYGISMNKGITLASLLENITMFFTGKLLFLLSLPLVILNIKNSKHDKNLSFYLLFSSLLLVLVINGGTTDHRFQFPLFFGMIYFIFSNLSNISTRYSINLISILLLTIILIDSKIDKSISRVKNMISTYSKFSEKEIINKRIPYTKLWETLPKSNDDVFIYSDYLSQSYYAPLNYHNHQVHHVPDSYFILKCDGPNDLKNLKKYSYALITRNIQNRCYEKIKQGKLIKTVDGTSLYDIRFKN